MPSYRISLISNTNQSQKITFLLPTPTSSSAVLKAAKDKLRLKKPSRIFLLGGDEITADITPHLQNGADFLISCGEEFIGLRKPTAEPTMCEVSVIAKRSFVDPIATAQLHATASLPGMRTAVGMPDLHPGTKSPVGAAFITEGYVHPLLIGGDIGCGMAVYRTNFTAADVTNSEVKRLAEKLFGLEGPWTNDVPAFLSHYLSPEEIKDVQSWESSLGTIGAGNHFAELQLISEATESFTADEVVLVVHSGSRGLGQQILHDSQEFYQSDEASVYLYKHDIACRWAKANRDLIALRFLSCLGKDLTYDDVVSVKILDIWHNNVECIEGDMYIHRKGAAPATEGLVIIPGSRGTLSAYVKPNPTSTTAYSLAHGAGRAQSRSSIFKKLSKRFRPEELHRTKLGGWVVCEDKELIYEEAPEGYKEVESVIADLVDVFACTVVAWGMPRLSYKVRK